jgi:hypothetical protein
MEVDMIAPELVRSFEGAARDILGSPQVASGEPPIDTRWNHAAQQARTWEDFEFKFDGSFIFSAYQTILGRDPDPEGFSHYLLHLRRGKSKIQIFAELLQSAEYRARHGHLNQLHRALVVRESMQSGDDNCTVVPKEREPNSQIGLTTRNVFAYSDDAFVAHVSHYLLGTLPDLQIITEYVARMKAGLSKAQVLTELMNSKPAKLRVALLRRIGSEVRRRRLARIPIFGPLIRMYFDIEGDSAIEQRLRRIENRLFSNGQIESHSRGLDKDRTAGIPDTEREDELLDFAPGLESSDNAEYIPVATKSAAMALRSLPEPEKWVDEKDNV